MNPAAGTAESLLKQAACGLSARFQRAGEGTLGFSVPGLNPAQTRALQSGIAVGCRRSRMR
jgi:hypothetical protein